LATKVKLGYFAAHEQRSPVELLENSCLAEKSGFQTVWSSDHFHPWFHTGAHGGFAWCWIAALAERTRRIAIGTGVTAPILRYHPAVIAQAFATLADLYPGRIFLGLGSGEAMNETPLGLGWPAYSERIQRFEEAVKIILALWKGDWVNYKGAYFELRDARLYTKPNGKVPLYIAACGSRAALLAGRYADGLLTLPMPMQQYQEIIFPALAKGAQLSNRDENSIEKVLEMEVSYDENYDRALRSCGSWAGTMLRNCVDISDPRVMEENGRAFPIEKLAEHWFIFTEPEMLIKKIDEYARLGFHQIQFLSSSPEEKKFIQIMGEKVIPYFQEASSADS
jgi:coenzyme F420-dependent glucose-6-phosphate dehydrogenase